MLSPRLQAQADWFDDLSIGETVPPLWVLEIAAAIHEGPYSPHAMDSGMTALCDWWAEYDSYPLHSDSYATAALKAVLQGLHNNSI